MSAQVPSIYALCRRIYEKIITRRSHSPKLHLDTNLLRKNHIRKSTDQSNLRSRYKAIRCIGESRDYLPVLTLRALHCLLRGAVSTMRRVQGGRHTWIGNGRCKDNSAVAKEVDDGELHVDTRLWLSFWECFVAELGACQIMISNLISFDCGHKSFYRLSPRRETCQVLSGHGG